MVFALTSMTMPLQPGLDRQRRRQPQGLEELLQVLEHARFFSRPRTPDAPG